MKPVQDMRRLGAHLQLERTQCVIAIGKKRHLLVHLQALRVQHLMQASLRLGGVIRLDKPKTFVPEDLVLFTLANAQRTLTHNDESMEMLGIMPPPASHPPQGPCPDTSA